MNNENKLVPKLRFPDFKDNGEWELMQISNILNAESSNLALNKLELKQSGYAVYGADSIVGYIENFQHKEPYISIVKDGSGVGRLNLCDGETSTLGTLSSLKSKDEKKYKVVWAFYLLNTIDFSSYVKGSGIPHIYFSDYKSENIGVPKTEEQQKIAACLSSLDEVIAGESQKLELLKEHKKGLLQNLFPQEGETVPKVRFPEFNNDGEWKEYPIDSIGEVVTGGTPSKEDKEYWGGDFVWVTAQDFKDKYITDSVLKLTQKGKEKSKIIPKDSVLVTCIASIGLNGINKVECATNQQINSVVCNSENHYEFVYYSITKNGNRLKNLAGQTAVPIINKSVFEKFIIHKPKSYQEQQKIATCLSSLDDLIAAQSQKIETLKLHKKGLLQGLFPPVKEDSNG
ncbi:MAG: restriction endonuclease subunit S [Dysgonomonadaceae bacterium]|nr:restriction endonuclease subunit S [Dysgonamonadaceae bacterium]